MKKLLVCLLALLFASLPALENENLHLLVNAAAVEAKDAPSKDPSSDGRMEGGGFASPEDAVTAYLEAMKAGDLSGMLSTFAIETYIQNVNAAASLERMRAFVPRDVLPLPLGGEYQRQIATAVRCAELVDDLYLQMLTLSWPEAYSDSYNDMIVQFEDEDGIDDFLAAMADSDIDAMLQGLELTSFADPTELSERYASEAVQQIIEKQRSAYGCDEIADVAALVTLGGEEYYQFMQCVRYGEKWYNFTQAGTLSHLMVADSRNAGLVAVADLEEDA